MSETTASNRVIAAALALFAAAALALVALPSKADAATDLTGVFTGDAIHGPFSFAPDLEPYETDIVLRVNGRRITGMYLEARLECPEVAIRDLRYSRLVMRKKIPIGSGGGFSFERNHIRVRGTIGRRAASGSLSASYMGCETPGVEWSAKKRRF